MDKTRIIILDKSEWVSNTKIDARVWTDSLEKDPEKDIHTIDLYKIWHEKKEFLRRAINLNPFNHDDFVWADAGICRDPYLAKLIKDFPKASRIPTDRVMLLNISPFTIDDYNIDQYKDYSIKGNFLNKDRIGGGIIAGPAKYILLWADLYDKVFNKYVSAGRFVGKDQSIMATVFLENKHMVSLVAVNKIMKEQWFYLLFYLGVNDRLFSYISRGSIKLHQSYEALLDKFY